jgi:hypothetical protein
MSLLLQHIGLIMKKADLGADVFISLFSTISCESSGSVGL